MAVLVSHFCAGSGGHDPSADGLFSLLVSDLLLFILSVSGLFVIEIVVILPGCLSHLFIGVHDMPHIWRIWDLGMIMFCGCDNYKFKVVSSEVQ